MKLHFIFKLDCVKCFDVVTLIYFLFGQYDVSVTIYSCTLEYKSNFKMKEEQDLSLVTFLQHASFQERTIRTGKIFDNAIPSYVVYIKILLGAA